MVSAANEPYIVGRTSEVHLRDMLQDLAASRAKRAYVGTENRAKAVAEYDEQVMIARYAALYDEAMGRPGTLG